MNNQNTSRWHSFEKFFFILFGSLFFVALSLSGAIKHDLPSLAVLVIGCLACVISLFVIFKGGVWVEVNNFGIEFQNAFGHKCFSWIEISSSYVSTVRLTHIASVQMKNGKSHTLPIAGAKAKIISEIINKRLSESET